LPGHDAVLRTKVIALPHGRVTLSYKRTERVWSVAVAPFELAALLVTQAEYLEVTGAAIPH
jgi:formylglycine-generating enzyme